jgi:hypothetical protein
MDLAQIRNNETRIRVAAKTVPINPGPQTCHIVFQYSKKRDVVEFRAGNLTFSRIRKAFLDRRK